jgi:hypothetical protein
MTQLLPAGVVTEFFRTTAGTVVEMDRPTDVHARESFDRKLANGELVPLAADQVEKVFEEFVSRDEIRAGFHWVEKGSQPPAAASVAQSAQDVMTAVRGGPPGTEATEGWEARARKALAAERAKGDAAAAGLIHRLESALATADASARASSKNF